MSCLEWDRSQNSLAWFARIQSESNPADGPSRLKPESVKQQLGAVEVVPFLPDKSDIAIQGKQLVSGSLINRRK
jgi:hypothetical protein